MKRKIVNDIYYENIKVEYYEKNDRIKIKNIKNIFYLENDEIMSRNELNDIIIVCSECDTEINLKMISKKMIDTKYLCRSCRNSGERNGMYGKNVYEIWKNKYGIDIADKKYKKLIENRSGENNYWYGKNITEELKNKISIANKGKLAGNKNPMYGKSLIEHWEETLTHEESMRKWEESNKKRSQKMSGEFNPFYGKKHDSKTRKKISETLKNSDKNTSYRNKDYREKMSQLLKGRKFSNEHRRKLRLARIKQIEENLLNNNQLSPNYNPYACDILNNISKETNTKIQHAMNGGEYHIKELGYWVDGYDKENNIVYEIDEKHHFNNDGMLKEKDIIRQTEITEYLNCEFIRIKYDK